MKPTTRDSFNDRDAKDLPKEDQSASSDDIQYEPSDAAVLSSDRYAQDWSAAEERKLVFKLDAIIMTILILAFFCMQVDRGNIGNAIVNGFLEDVGINRAHYNIGQQLLYLGIVVLEVSFFGHVIYRLLIMVVKPDPKQLSPVSRWTPMVAWRRDYRMVIGSLLAVVPLTFH